ncbi:MAG: hypothetical protein A2451_11970 [Bdellovibrionales bacterium RIFOXYC2_FULL_39_8]|nr:MAG: hypothetical protein A2451_11970 [Bdellovibrionales bacterium RIFOXYC2_FULL_39_8]
MPELPEVETIKRQLTEYLPLSVNKSNIAPLAKKIIKTKKQFSLENIIITQIKRYGKYLIFYISEDKILLSHLGMSGSWQISNKPIDKKHTHLQLYCTNPSEKTSLFLAYIDPRRFGQIYFMNRAELEKKISTLGVDISTEDLTTEYIYQACQLHPQKKIKALLLDQKFFAGVGNYIASEICAHAHLLPARECRSISKKEAAKIKLATKKVIERSIKRNGLTFHGGYTDASGNKGEAIGNLIVFYQKQCGFCQSEIKKIIIDGRGTYFCPKCQQ